MFAALSAFGSWAGKRKRLLAGVVGVAVKTASACVSGVSLAAEMLGDLAEKAAETLLDPETRIVAEASANPQATGARV